ncbi:MAG: hypothetical protein WBC71_04400 [Salaquimonas sp.]
MKKLMGLLAVGGIALSTFATSVSAQSMGDKAISMMQCSSACNTQYLQCVASAQQLASTPMDGLSQIKTNFMNSTECGKAAMACNSSCG